MKKIRLMLAALACGLCIASMEAQTVAQKDFMDEIISFLKMEGYMPSYDSDGDIQFKIEGASYWISVDEGGGDAPFFVNMFRSGYTLEGENAFSYAPAVLACNYVTSDKKAAKLYCLDTAVRPSAQFFVSGITEFRKVYPRYLSCLKTVFSAFEDKYYEYEKQKD